MKKIIGFVLVGITLIFSTKAQAFENVFVDFDSIELLDANTYSGGHSDFFVASYETIEAPVESQYDYQNSTTVRFPVDYYCEYLIMPLQGETLGFHNFEYEGYDYAIHENYKNTTGPSFNRENQTISLPSEDNSYLLTLSDSNSLSQWQSMLGGDIIDFAGKKYSVSNALVAQSHHTNEASFSAYTHYDISDFLICRLYRNPIGNTIYEGKDPYVITSVTEPISREELLKYITVKDNYDANAASTLQIIDGNYTAENTTLATYYLSLQARDSSGNYVRQKIYIKAVDYTKPEISGKTSFTGLYDRKLDILSLAKSELKAVDNWDGELTDFYIVEDNYSSNYKTLGTYTFIVGVKDSSNNEARIECSVTVVDKTAPLVTITGNLAAPVGSSLLSKEEIISLFNCYDAYDKDNLTVTLEQYESYAENYTTIGSYSMNLKVVDQSGNCFEYSFKFAVTDKESPTIEVTGDIKTIIVPSGQILTEEEVLEIIKSSDPSKTVVSIASLYFSQENPKGDYEILVTYEDGSVGKYKLSMETSAVEKESSLYLYFIGGGGVIILGVIAKLIYDKKRGAKRLTKAKK